MVRVKVAALFIVALLILAGCSAFFDFNAFSAMDTVPAPKASDYEGLGGLEKLAQDLNSPAIVAKLKEDPATTQAIENYLLTSYLSAGVNTVDQQEAAVLYCDLYLQTTAAEEFVNNIVTTVVSGVSGTTIQDLLSSIIPPEAKNDPTVFLNMVQALLLSNTQYLALGAGLVDVNKNGKIDVGEGVPPDMNMGDVEQKAAVAYTMAVIYQQISRALPELTEDQIISQIYLLSTDPTAADPAVQNLTPDPYNAAGTDPPADPYVAANLPNLQKLFDCAGIALPG